MTQKDVQAIKILTKKEFVNGELVNTPDLTKVANFFNKQVDAWMQETEYPYQVLVNRSFGKRNGIEITIFTSETSNHTHFIFSWYKPSDIVEVFAQVESDIFNH